MNWDEFECENCKLIFAIKQTQGDEIEEPACPGCGQTNCQYLGQDPSNVRSA